ncbi:MAG: hypothetical protein MUF42_08210 [Cytophagaceae bacterium]|jgi:hypothetical protein|nr:hypothetical protein [Cytophagaceae bacterium]
MIRKRLLGSHSKANTEWIIRYIGNRPDRFNELLLLFLGQDPVLAQRAAWSLGYVAEQQPQLVQPYLLEIVSYLKKDDLHDALYRNVFRFLQFITWDPELDGQIFDLAINCMHPSYAVAIRVFAMSTAWKVVQRHPGLASELKLKIEEQWPYASPAFKSRAKKIMSGISSLTHTPPSFPVH